MIVQNVPQNMKWRTYRGDTASFSILVKDDAGLPEDLTGWTFAGQIRKTLEGLVIANLSIVAGVGVLTVTLEAEDSLILYPQNLFDIQATKPDTSVWTLIQGSIVVEGDVTR